MYDYRLVFVYPLSMPIEDLSELEENALEQLERSISKTVDDGWEYVSTTTFSKTSATETKTSEKGLKAFVYRRFRGVTAEFTGTAASALLQPLKNQTVRHEEDPALIARDPVKERKQSTLLTLAMLNAVNAHSNISPDTILPKLTQQGDISEEESKLLSSTLKKRLSAAEVAAITPAGKEKDVFRVSLMPFGDTDDAYADYIAELAVYLDLDDAFIAHETSRKRL